MATPIDIATFLTPAPAERPVGCVAIVGRPNAGKSTLVNAIIGEKVSIVSPRPQTTRQTIRGIYTTPDIQIVFLDTPGLHEEVDELSRAINHHAIIALRRAHVIVRCIDPTRPRGEEDERIDRIIGHIDRPIITITTKADVDKNIVIEGLPVDTIRISAVTKEGCDTLIDSIRRHLPVGPLMYEEDVYTDQNMHERISEIIREKFFLALSKELPYSIFIEIEEIDDGETLMRILSTVFVERESQKSIVIGQNASVLKEVGIQARHDLEEIFGKKVFLQTRVKVLPKWKKQAEIVKRVIS